MPLRYYYSSGCPAIHQDEFQVPHLPMRSQLFLLTMYGHACPILINFSVVPIVLRSTGQDAALMNGRRASRADLIVASGGSRMSEGVLADLKTSGNPAAEGTMSMGDSRYWEPIFKVDIVNSSGALSSLSVGHKRAVKIRMRENTHVVYF
jgi:hypothetical protein